MKYHPKGLRLVAMTTEYDGPQMGNIHVVRFNLGTGKFSKTACGIGMCPGFAFPFHRWIWENKNSPICEDCFQEVNGKIRRDVW